MRGYYAIGIWHPKTETNVGTMWRSAFSFGAAFVFTVGRRYREQSSDTCSTPKQVPLFHYRDVDDLLEHLPKGCPLVAIECGAALAAAGLPNKARTLDRFTHPERACYLLGAEDHGLPAGTLKRAHHVVEIPFGSRCLNVASAGTIVCYDRVQKEAARMRLVEGV